jgi:hypothetical protein
MATTNGWKRAAKRALVSGTVSSLLSTAALYACGRNEQRAGAGPVGAPSQWLWGRQRAYRKRPSAAQTLAGYAVHHVAATGWSMLYEKWCGDRPPSVAAGALKAAATAGLACYVDFRLTPLRLRPGYEVQLSKPSLSLVYAAFAMGLAIAALRKR